MVAVTLCYANGHLNLERIERLVRQLSDLANQGKEVILVSSGATGAGLAPLGFKEKPRDLVLKQAAAAVRPRHSYPYVRAHVS